MLSLSGTGIKQSANFTITHDQWTINYHYDCSGFGGQGNFIVDVSRSDGTSAFGADGVNELGSGGTSSTVQHGSGTFYLSVNSECAWSIQVVG